MSLKDIVDVLGGEVHRGGNRAHIPAPGHSTDDRSVSLLLQNNRLIIHSFTDGGDWRAIRDDLRERGFINAAGELVGAVGNSHGYHAPEVTKVEKQAVARRIWELGRPTAGTLSERHARIRGIGRPLPGPDVVRHVQDCPLAIYDQGTRTKPAMVTAIRTPDGDLTAIEITYLAPNGQREDRLRIARKMVGPIPQGSAVRIDPVTTEMAIGEGYFTSLSASERFSLPTWAALSTAIMRNFVPPVGVRSVLVAGDNGPDGTRTAHLLVDRIRERGLKAWAEFPPIDIDDFNTLARRDAAATPP